VGGQDPRAWCGARRERGKTASYCSTNRPRTVMAAVERRVRVFQKDHRIHGTKKVSPKLGTTVDSRTCQERNRGETIPRKNTGKQKQARRNSIKMDRNPRDKTFWGKRGVKERYGDSKGGGAGGHYKGLLEPGTQQIVSFFRIYAWGGILP